MRILFAGTPGIAVPSLKRLFKEHEIVSVLTNPDSRKGRGRRKGMSEVKQAALDLGLPILQPQRLDAAVREKIAGLQPDLLVCVAYGKIFRQVFLDLFPEGGINLHPSKLPLYRGPSPVNAVLLAGDQETAVTVQRLALRMDSGNILMQEILPLSGRETVESLLETSGERGAELVAKTVLRLENHTVEERPQNDDEATYCSLIRKEDALIDWTGTASEIERMVRGYYPKPAAHTLWKGEGLRILEADTSEEESGDPPGTVVGYNRKKGYCIQTGKGQLIARRLQLSSKKALDYQAFNNGIKDFIGSILGDNK